MNEIEKLVKRLRAAGHKLTVKNTWGIIVTPPCSIDDTLLIQKLNKGEKLADYIKEHP
jgi:hypothetical protein|nr:MAG TPA: Nonribosomal peptide synthetase StoC, PEPTIDE BINDING PROTEIN [Caudoviricetes sp.]